MLNKNNCWQFVGVGVGVALGLALLAALPPVEAAKNSNPRILPSVSRPYGLSYGEWAAEWWKWVVAIPADESPLLDSTGEFAAMGQEGPVWFLAGAFGGTAERTVTIPKGKALFFPIGNSLWWWPDDIDSGVPAWAAEEMGLDPTQMTDEELIRWVANFQVGVVTSISATIDGVAITDLEQYRADSPEFSLAEGHTALLDDLGVPVSQPNGAVTAGYWLMVAPLTPGEHTIQFAIEWDNPLFGPFSLDVSYILTVN